MISIFPLPRQMLEYRIQHIDRRLDVIPGEIEALEANLAELREEQSRLKAERQDVASWLATGRMPI